MQQAIFEKNSHDRLTRVTFDQLFSQDRVLVCSANNPHNRVTQVYLKHLERLQKKLRPMGISRIYVINSFDRWLIAVVEKFFPTLTALFNPDRLFVGELIDRHNAHSRWSRDFLAEFWEYQVVLSAGRIEHFAHSATEDLTGKVLEGIGLMRPRMRALTQEGKSEMLYRQNTLRLHAQHTPDLVLRQPEFFGDTNFTRHIRYQGLWPNESLRLHLGGDRSTA